ncbi:MAG: type I methionyl aminopeptidase [Spirochaetes bacterium]|jgi:methionyl aminopeptidase|nr:type I methionyl aminopeptidase [Spirochaetota bacterium]
MRRSSIRLKTPDDIERIGEAGRIISGIFRDISKMSLNGVSTWDLDFHIEGIILKKKARPAFKTVVGYNSASCLSINSEVVHGVPAKKKKIKSGDIIKIDLGVVLNGYFCDACRTFCVDDISENARKLVKTASECLGFAVEVMSPGARIGDIGWAIQSHAESAGFSVVRDYTGHGVGYALHEPPVVPHYGIKGNGMPLEPGLVLAVEPMINEGTFEVKTLDDGWTAVTVDGGLSAQFEHTVAVTEKGPLILTG